MMPEASVQFAFIGPGGPELIVVMLVLIVMFGAKDAPKMFRKINEFMSHIRNTAEGFKREIMYGDLNSEPTAAEQSASEEAYDFVDDDHDEDYEYYGEDEERAYSDDTFQSLEKDLESIDAVKKDEPPEAEDEDDDAQKA